MTGLVRRALRLPAPERRAVVFAAAIQLLVAAAIRVVGLRTMLRAIDRPGRSRPLADLRAVARALWAIDAAGRHLGRASSCLARALTAHWIARRSGVRLPISIGVARGADGALDAHAWIAGPANLRLAAPSTDRYAPLLVLGGAAADEPQSPHAG